MRMLTLCNDSSLCFFLVCNLQLVEINKKARIKLSEDVEKVTIPGRKNVYRLYGADGKEWFTEMPDV